MHGALNKIVNSSVEILDLEYMKKPLKIAAIMYTSRVITISGFQTAILNFRFLHALHNIDNCSVELLNLENMGVVFKNLQLSCMHANL